MIIQLHINGRHGICGSGLSATHLPPLRKTYLQEPNLRSVACQARNFSADAHHPRQTLPYRPSGPVRRHLTFGQTCNLRSYFPGTWASAAAALVRPDPSNGQSLKLLGNNDNEWDPSPACMCTRRALQLIAYDRPVPRSYIGKFHAECRRYACRIATTATSCGKCLMFHQTSAVGWLTFVTSPTRIGEGGLSPGLCRLRLSDRQ